MLNLFLQHRGQPHRLPPTFIIEPVILSGKITEAHISKSENYPMIAERLSAITQLKAALETEFTVYQFNAKVLPFHTSITAQNLISAQCGDVVFLFTDSNTSGEAFSKSAFLKRPDHDFTTNQKHLPFSESKEKTVKQCACIPEMQNNWELFCLAPGAFIYGQFFAHDPPRLDRCS